MEILTMLNIFTQLLTAKETQLFLEREQLAQTVKLEFTKKLLKILTFTKLQPK